LIISNAIGVITAFLIFLVLIFGLIRKFHDLDVFSRPTTTKFKDILYVGIPLLVGFGIMAVVILINLIFFSSGIFHDGKRAGAEKTDDCTDSENIFLNPITHLVINIMIFILSILYIAFFIFIIGLRLLRHSSE